MPSDAERDAAENRIPRPEPDALTEARAWAGCLGDIADREAPDQYARIALAHAAIAIAERLDALRRTIAAAHGLCIQCMERPRLEALRICGTCYRIGVPHGQDAA